MTDVTLNCFTIDFNTVVYLHRPLVLLQAAVSTPFPHQYVSWDS